MAQRRIHPLIRDAVTLAQMAGWSVEYLHNRVKIGIPGIDGDGKSYLPLSVDLDPNEATMDKWRATARTYKLEMPGPASTPWEREQAEKAAIEKAAADKVQSREDAKDKQQQIAAVKAKQLAEIEVGRNAPAGLFSQSIAAQPVRATVPVSAPVFVPPVPAIVKSEKKETPVVTAPPVKKSTPEFKEWMLTASRDKLRLADGQYFCPECLREGVEFLAKMGQGLTSHRGIKHGLFAQTKESPLVTDAVLPENLRVALDMLSGEMVETLAKLGSGPDAAKKDAEIARLSSEVVELRAKYETAFELAGSRDSALNEAHETLKNLKAEVERVRSEKGGLEATILKGFEIRLREMRTFAQTLSPVQAVGKIDEAIGVLLDD